MTLRVTDQSITRRANPSAVVVVSRTWCAKTKIDAIVLATLGSNHGAGQVATGSTCDGRRGVSDIARLPIGIELPTRDVGSTFDNGCYQRSQLTALFRCDHQAMSLAVNGWPILPYQLRVDCAQGAVASIPASPTSFAERTTRSNHSSWLRILSTSRQFSQSFACEGQLREGWICSGIANA